LVIAAVGFALYRRLVLHPRRLEGDHLEHTDALIILSMIMGLMVTLLLATACLLVVEPTAFGNEKIVSRPLAMALGAVLSPAAASPHGEGAGADRRPDGVPAPRAAPRRGRRRRRDDRRRDHGPSAARHVHHRGRALGLHELPCLRRGMSGVDRSARRHQRAAPR